MALKWADPDHLNRTSKQLIDSGRAADPVEAEAILKGMVLQVAVGPGLEHNPSDQAALLTVVNAGHRAFLGGVRVKIEDDPVLTAGWGSGLHISDAILRFGGQLGDDHTPDHPTLAIGTPSREPIGRVTMWTTAHRWSGGLVQDRVARLRGDGITLAGVAAGALGVSESFQNCLGSVVAGRRDIGLSLWRPELDWRESEAAGPSLSWLPRSLWLLGLGHLGQGYAWSLGWLPYLRDSRATAYLVDFDPIVKGNLATGLLSFSGDLDMKKARVVADRLESRGLATAIIERRFDDSLLPVEDEPGLALAGFDDPAPRRLLGGGRFARAIDGGLGAGHDEYLDIVLHTFPSQLDPEVEFATRSTTPRPLPAAYESEALRRIAEGVPDGDARCGMTAFAGIAVGAAFVGAVAGALVVADPLRLLHGGEEIAVLSIDLRSPGYVSVVANKYAGDYIPPAVETSG